MALRLMAIHAHPDDETIATGGLLATLHDRGITTCVVTCTDGKYATIYNLPEAETRPKLVQVRKEELRRATEMLGVDRVVTLDFGDSGMQGSITNALPDSFCSLPIDVIVKRLVKEIRDFRPHVVVTYDPIGAYAHPDHIQAHRGALLAVEAARTPRLYQDCGVPWTVSKLYYAIFPISVFQNAEIQADQAGITSPFSQSLDVYNIAMPDDWVTTTVNCQEAIPRKRAAMREHTSQMPADFPFLAIPEPWHIAHFGDEHYHLAMCRVPTTLPETDVFAGVAGD